MANEVCFRNLHLEKSWTLESYEKVGGYSVWRNILKNKPDPKTLLEEIKISNLRGRGGAGFPTGVKWSFIKRDAPCQKYIICNSAEGEPGTCKDRDIVRYNPHQIIEGMCIESYIMNATIGYHYLRGEFVEPYEVAENALKEAYKEGLLGKNIKNSGIDFDLHNCLGAGGYICGEETALLNSFEGKRGLPRLKPPFPANYGLYGNPTTINNTETIASIPVILEKGGKWFSELGKPNNGGTKIFCISGHVNKPGNYEVRLGTPFKKLLEMAGGIRENRKLKAVIPGGSSMPVLPADIILNLDMDYDSLSEAGSYLGSGGIIVMDQTTCMVNMLLRIAEFYMDESCGECSPCREGSGWIFRIIERIIKAEGQSEDVSNLQRIAGNIEGRTICAFGEAVAWPVKSFVHHFGEEFEYYIKHKKSMVN